MPFERVHEYDFTPITGITPTWIFYGLYNGTARPVEQRPIWREFKIGPNPTGVWGFTPWSQDIQQGVVWIVDFGSGAERRFRAGCTTPDRKAFLHVDGETLVDYPLPALTTSFLDLTYAPGASVALAKVTGVTGLALATATPAFAELIKKKSAVSYASFGYDDLYDMQHRVWGHDPLLTSVGADLSVLAQNPAWPAALPQEPFADGNPTYEPVENVIRTENETGPVQVRRRYSGNVEHFSFTMVLSPEQMAVLEVFRKATLKEAKPFTWVDFRTMQPATYRFSKRYTSEYFASAAQSDNPHFWRVALTLELLS